MKHLLILSLICLQASLLNAQSNSNNQPVPSEKEVRHSHLDALCEFPGGNQSYRKWIDANIRIPEGFTGSEVVVIRCKILPDGTITEPTPVRQKRSKNAEINEEAMRLISLMPKMQVTYYTSKHIPFFYYFSIRFTAPNTIYIPGNAKSFTAQFPELEQQIRKLYETQVFHTQQDSDFKIGDICTQSFLKRLAAANDYDSPGYATWLLRSGMQDGDDSPSQVLSVVPAKNNTIIVSWTDMGHQGSTTLTMTESDGRWKINNATVPEGFTPL